MKRIFLSLGIALMLSQTACVTAGTMQAQENGTTSIVQAGPDIAIVAVAEGKLQGYIHNGIYTYHGVPYAEAKERFVPAEKAAPWQGIRPAFNFGAIAPQAKPNPIFDIAWEAPARYFEMSNNAQNLNIWTPAINDNGKRPVMVWLHGGGFSTGSSAAVSSYEGENLSRKGDVVVVSVNHRLNVLGHLDLSQFGEKYKNSANVGIIDLIAALEWIRANIDQFGGDPNNVTIFGESGDGAKVLALMTTPNAKGLFQKAIIQSGATETMGVRFIDTKASRRVTELTLQHLNIDKNRIEALQTLPYETLAAASDKALQQTAEELKLPSPFGSHLGYALMWEPVVDGGLMPSNPVLTQGFAAAANDIPLLIGSNLTEWQAMSMLTDLSKAQFDNPKTWSDEETEQKLTALYGDNKEAVVVAFLQAYPDKKRGDAMYVDSTVIRLPMLKIMSHKAEQSTPVYAYLFSWESPLMNGAITAYHTAEIPFVFSNIDKAASRIGGGREAEILQDKMSTAWINFARHGNPNHAGLPEWQPYNRENGATMIFDNSVRLTHKHDAPLIQLLAPDYQY